MISIIIPIYNQAHSIWETLNSLNQQTYRDFEVIMVNDGSTDGLDKSLENYFFKHSVNYPCLVLHERQAGAPAARNRGWQKARGEFLFFCDADVILKPEALALMLENLINHPEASYVYSSFLWGKKLFTVGQFDSARLKQGPYINTMALIRRADFPATGWDEGIKKLQDWDLWLTMLAAGKFGYWINQVLYQVKTGGQISSWLPESAYKLLPWLPAVKKYQAAIKIVKEKHHLI